MNDSVTLAPPGAGIPTAERLLGKLLIAAFARLRTRSALARDFRRVGESLLWRVERAGSQRSSHAVLVPRLTGLEDSSRRWSSYQVLAHLVVVDDGIARICVALASDEEPDFVVDIADYKPAPDTGSEVLTEFARALDGFERRIAGIGDLATARRWVHPWFGPLDARWWVALAALHHRIHARQLAAILASPV